MFAEAPAPYYRIRLDPPPKTVWLRNMRAKNYRYHFDAIRPEVFEINYLQEGNLCELRREGEVCFEQGTVRVLVENRRFVQYSTTPFTHELYLYVRLQEPAIPMTEEQVRNWVCSGKEAILPGHITEPGLCRRIAGLLRSELDHGADPVGQLRLRACLQNLLVLLTQYALKQAKSTDEGPADPYIRKACQYIRSHMAQKLTVTEVAAFAGVSYDYLKTLFRRQMGMSILEYINHTRIRALKQLLRSSRITLEEAGALVGIPDPAYLSRLFRKMTGMTVRQFRQGMEE